MQKIILILTLTFLSPVFAYDLGNTLDSKEYPETIMLEEDKDNAKVISGTITKTIDMNLSNCIQIALGNNPEIDSAFQDILAKDAMIKQSWSNFFPRISWQTSWSHIKQLQLSDALSRNLEYEYYLLGQASIDQLIYDFGITQNQATINRLGYEASKKNFGEVVNDVICRTKNAYYKVLFAYKEVEIQESAVENYQLFYNQAKAFYQVGLNPKVDVTIAQANLSNAKLRLIQAKTSVNIAMTELNNIMGVPYFEKYSINDTLEYKPISIDFEEAVNIAKKSRPNLKRAQILVEQAHQNLNLAKKSFMPTLHAEGQYQTGGKHWTSNDGWNIGMYLNFTSINAMLIRNEIKEARYQYDMQIAEAVKVQNNIYQEIQKAYLTLNEKKNQIPVAGIQVKQAKENYELSLGRYKVGEASPIEMREAENTLINSRLNYFTALYEYNVAKSNLERAIGKNLI